MNNIIRVDKSNGYYGSTLFGFKALADYDDIWDVAKYNEKSPAAHLYRNSYENMIGLIRSTLRGSYETSS